MLVSYQLLDESKCVKINQQHNFFLIFSKNKYTKEFPFVYLLYTISSFTDLSNRSQVTLSQSVSGTYQFFIGKNSSACHETEYSRNDRQRSR